jgi:hypothetical protein
VDHPRLERLLEALHRTDDTATVLRRLCVVCIDRFGVNGAALSAVDNGQPRVLEASDDRAADVAAIQWELADGPCLEALATFRPAAGSDLTTHEASNRWPRFAPAATEHGILAAFAFPLLNGGVATGTLDLYDRTIRQLDTDQNADAIMVAGLATLAIEQRDSSLGIDEVGISVEPTAPWAHPAVVHNATGMLSAQLSISLDDALLRLRALAFVRNRTVTELARDIVTRHLTIEPWIDDE